MATITQELTLVTSWKQEKDAQTVVQMARNSSTHLANSLTVYYVGEYHNLMFDVERRRSVIHALNVPQSPIVLVLERGFTQKATVMEKNLVVEPMSDAKSSDDRRNSAIVGRLEAHLEDTGGFVRTVVFLFGQIHEKPIREYIEAMYPKALTVRWVRSPSLVEHVENEPMSFSSRFDTSNLTPAGYVIHDMANPDPLMLLLQKGRVHESFNMELISASVANMLRGSCYAIYFREQKVNLRFREQANKDGSTNVTKFVRMNGAQIVVAKLVKCSEAV